MKLVESIVSCVCASAFLAWAPAALAQPEATPATPAPAAPVPAAPAPAAPVPAATGPQAVLPPEAPGDELKEFTITANPLSIAVGRYSFNFEYMAARHHGLILVPSIWMLSSSAGDESWKYRYLGGELGYHFYTGDRGANGFFVGPSLVFMNMHTTAQVSGLAEASASTSVYGAAFDVGGQYVSQGGFTIGGGFGVMYVKVASQAAGAGKPSVSVDGVLPRALFTIGYSF